MDPGRFTGAGEGGHRLAVDRDMRAIQSALFSLSLLACAIDTPPDEAVVEVPEVPDQPIAYVAQTGFIEHADAVPGSYIVILKDTRAPLDVTIDRVAEVGRATVGNRYTHGVRGFAATMTADDARALASDPDVAYVEANQRMYGDASVTNNATWGIDRIDQANLPLDTRYYGLADGSTVTAYVVDTGIRGTHTEFTGRLLPGFAGVADGQGTNDCNGHGTHVGGTIGGAVLGVAKKVNVVPVRTLGCENSGTLDAFLAGVDWVIANKQPRSVANMSVAFNPPNTTVDNKVRALINAGVTVIVSAGNRTTDACTQSPARVPEAITVAAIDKADARAAFSNYGTCVDLFAPGVDILSASYTGDTLARLISGTSQATPHVAGVAALYLSTHPTATPAQIAAALISGTVPNKVTDIQGSPNRLLSVKVVDTTAPVVSITAPSSGANVDASFTVTGSATDVNLRRVGLKIDGVEVATAPAAGAFELAATGLAPGPHVVEIVATDLADLATVQSISVMVKSTGGTPNDPSDPSDPNEPTQTAGGCSTTGGGAPGALGILLALVVCTCNRRRHRRTL
jgi:subtilisin family serine protease